jgi:hypothetical protein
VLRVGRIRLLLNRAEVKRIAVDDAYRRVLDVTRQTYNRANVLTPVDTGNLRAHNQMTASRTGNGARGLVYNDAEYAAVVHDGSGPYTIRPRTKKALRFTVGGQVVFAKSVRHPGTRARPWLARAGREVAARSGFTWTPG